MRVKNGKYLALYAILFLYSLSTVFSKLASQSGFLSMNFMAFYGLSLMLLFIYAIVWQQILKQMPLTVAYANKTVTIAFGMLWGYCLFNEPITWNMLLGSGILLVGIIMVASDDE